MLHWIAFVVIGLLTGITVSMGEQPNRPWGIVMAIVGGIIGGWVILHFTHGVVAKYGSLVASVFMAVVLGTVTNSIRTKPAR